MHTNVERKSKACYKNHIGLGLQFEFKNLK